MNIFKLLLEKDLPGAIILIVVLCVTIFETIMLAKIFLPLWFAKRDAQNNKKPEKVCGSSLQARHEKRLEKIEFLLEEDAADRKIRRAELDEILNCLNSSIKGLAKELSELEDRTDDVSRGTLENMLFNDDYPSMFNRLKALRRLIAMNVNGRVRDKGYLLVLNDKERWKDVYSMKMNLNIVDKEYYSKTMDYYNRLVHAN